MAGIYIHIPFCKQACHYCNFHFSTTLHEQDELVNMLIRELELRREYLPTSPLASVYLGGGTPSLLTDAQLDRLFKTIFRHYPVADNAEITLEANPDDLTVAKLSSLEKSAVNRLSIGIQSFFDADLVFMNRAHNSYEAKTCIDLAQKAGFDNLTIDLIYGSPTTTTGQWMENLDIAFSLGISHLSAYCLTVEPRTALDHFVRTGKVRPVEEKKSAQQYNLLVEQAEAAGYEQYEISNFARRGAYAMHNTAYWRGEPYLGIGPSAHSYDCISRQWTKPNNALYIRTMQKAGGTFPESLYEKETLSAQTRYNEYVMTGLRTKWGIDIALVQAPFAEHFRKESEKHIRAGHMWQKGSKYGLTKEGRLLADGIASDMFFTDESRW